MDDAIFRRIVEEAAHVAILVLDPTGRIVLWNPGAEEVFGYKGADILGQHFEMLFVPGDRQHDVPAREMAKAAAEGRASDNRWHLRGDARRIFVEGVTMALREPDGRLSGFAKFSRDLTERHQTERRLAAQLALTSLLSQEQPFTVTARRIMQTVCENLGWDVGALWEAHEGFIESVDFWHGPHVNAALARELCGPRRLPGRDSMPGRVIATAQPLWVMDFASENFPRAPIAGRAGLRGAFGFPIIRGDRAIAAMEFFSTAERDPDQALIPVMTLIGTQIGDFMERGRTQEALRESEERYRLVSETAQDVIFTVDEQGTVTFCNPAAARVLGWPPDELVGQLVDVIVPPRLLSGNRRGIEAFLQGARPEATPWTRVQLPLLHREGHEVACEISFGEWRHDDSAIFTAVARDVSERQRAFEAEQQARAAAEAVREQLERRAEEEAAFRHLASALTGAIETHQVLAEITSRATQVTRADGVYVERIVGTGSGRVVEIVSSAGRGAPPRGLRVAYPGSMTEEILKGATPVILASMDGFGREMAPYLAETCAHCQVLVTPLIAESEPLGALVLLNSGTSGRTFGDGDVIRARTLGDLASLAIRRVRLLEDERHAKERAEVALRVRDETLGIVSHDLRNPLAKVALSADLLIGSSGDEQAELIETIRSSARQMQRLIADLLDVARVETGRLSINCRTMQPEPLVREVCASNEALAAQKGQIVTCRVDGALPPIAADRERLVQVFGNLIGNAMKFAPEGGEIVVEARAERGSVVFAVADNGPGIPEADLRQVFTPYWQAKKTAHLGAGLGLAIVRGIVEAHGGHVWGSNGQSGGAVFTFTIPEAGRTP